MGLLSLKVLQMPEDFDVKLASLKGLWNKREEQFSSAPQFFSYFMKHKAPIFKNCLYVKGQAWGVLPQNYHNNCPECINHVIKMKVDRKESPLHKFCHKMKSLVQDQKNHLIRAITSRGEYRLHSVFKEFEVSPSKWFGVSRIQHLQILQNAASKFMAKIQFKSNCVLPTPSTSKGLHPNITSEGFQDASHILPEENRGDCLYDDGHDGIQEVCLEGVKGDYRCADWVTKIAKDTTFPETTIWNILEKAEELLADSTAITAAPLQGEARMVKSKSNPSHPHLVGQRS